VVHSTGWDQKYMEEKNMNITQSLKDPKTWVLFISFLKVFLAAIGIDIAPEQWVAWENVLNAACALAVGLGVFAYNPYEKPKEQQK
jgi:hypothetical protein